MEKHITAPLKESDIKDLKAGDYVYITGTIYTARDAAHKRMYETIGEHKELPIKMQAIMFISQVHFTWPEMLLTNA